MTSDRRLGLGLIGCGAFGRFCLEAFAQLDSIRLAAVADVAAPAADALGRDFGLPAYHDPAELNALADVDIVHIATPPATHYELAMSALRRGKHVLCEKPLAMNARQADDMLAAAERAGTIVPVNFVLRYSPVAGIVKRIIDSGAMGRVLAARLTNCASDSNLPPGHWFWNRSVSGGIFIEHAVHFFDLYRDWLGPGQVVCAQAEMREQSEQEDRVTCLVSHAGGALASHYHGFDQPHVIDRTDHRLVCELGDILVQGWLPLTVAVDAALGEEAMAAVADCFGGGVEVQSVEPIPPDEQRRPSRGSPRELTSRVRLQRTPQPDKRIAYAQAVRNLLADQVAYIRDRSHKRIVVDSDGRDAVALAEQAVDQAA